jgi:2-keto-3-deoxy-L-rhamnonate aldolase RhmA
VQIETAEALECVEQIAAVEGVEHLFVGPSDLSVSLGVPGQFMHERCTAALERISAAVKSAGKSWGILARSQEHAQFCKSLGCQLFAVGNDLASVLNGVRTLQGNFPAVFADSASAS